MNNKYWLGIDVGSTACKIVILNENNEIIKRARKNIETTPLKVVYEVLNELDEYVKYVQAIGIIVKETIGVGVNEKAVLRFYQTALSFTSISIFPW